jgi:hypothetical protein
MSPYETSGALLVIRHADTTKLIMTSLRNAWNTIARQVIHLDCVEGWRQAKGIQCLHVDVEGRRTALTTEIGLNKMGDIVATCAQASR